MRERLIFNQKLENHENCTYCLCALEIVPLRLTDYRNERLICTSCLIKIFDKVLDPAFKNQKAPRKHAI